MFRVERQYISHAYFTQKLLIAAITAPSGIVDLVCCTLDTRLSAAVVRKPPLPTYLHLSCHSSPRVLTAIQTGFGMLCVSGIILGDICGHISGSCKSECIVTVSDRPNLRRYVANSGWLVKCTSLWEPRVSDLTLQYMQKFAWGFPDLCGLDFLCII